MTQENKELLGYSKINLYLCITNNQKLTIFDF